MQLTAKAVGSGRYESELRLISVFLTLIPSKGQKFLPGTAINVPVNGSTTHIKGIEPKYPLAGYFRWIDANGYTLQPEIVIEYQRTRIIPPIPWVYGCEWWLRGENKVNIEMRTI